MDNKFVVKNYKTTATLNQRRMLADPFEIIMRNMRRTADDDSDMDRRPDQFEGGQIMPEHFYTCRPS